jgi:hypothetical protein
LEKSEDLQNLAEEIIETFVKENSPKEIYITKEERQKIFDDFKLITTESEQKSDQFLFIAYEGLFDNVKKNQYNELYRDVIPRFIRSKKTLNLLSKFVDDPNVIRSKQTAKFPYTNDDFKRQYITQMDFDFMKDLSKDDLNWELSLNS